VSRNQKESSLTASAGASGAPKKWVVVELTHSGEQEKDSRTLTRAIHRMLGRPLNVFVPSLSTDVREDSQILVYMDGYIFIEYQEGVQYMRLRDTSYFNEVLCASRGSAPVYSLIEDDQLNGIKKDMESIRNVEFELDDPVVVKSGTNRGMRGVVMDVQGDEITVKHPTRSKPCLLSYKSTYLTKVKPLA
jgi:hypothetical protein